MPIASTEKKSLGRRILIAFVRVAIYFAVLAVAIELIGTQTTIFITTRWVARRAPQAKVTPQPVADYSASAAPVTRLKYFGYAFEVPWSAGFKQKLGKGLVQLEFESGQNVTFIVPANQAGLLTEIADDPSLGMKNLRVIFGDLMNRSAYDQYAALVNVSPSSIHAFGPRAEAVRGETLLTLKAIALGPGLETGVFSFELPEKRGFQIGDPQKSKRADLEIFGMGGHHIEILCATTKDTISLTQLELNLILKSLHPVEEKSSVSAAPPANG